MRQEPKIITEQFRYRLQFDCCDVVTTKEWKYCKNHIWLNISTGIVVRIEERASLYNVIVYSLHNPGDRTTDYNNEVQVSFDSLSEALEAVNMFCGDNS